MSAKVCRLLEKFPPPEQLTVAEAYQQIVALQDPEGVYETDWVVDVDTGGVVRDMSEGLEADLLSRRFAAPGKPFDNSCIVVAVKADSPDESDRLIADLAALKAAA